MARLLSAMVASPEAARGTPERRVVTIPDRDHDLSLAAMRELQALDASWDAERHEAHDVRWID